MESWMESWTERVGGEVGEEVSKRKMRTADGGDRKLLAVWIIGVGGEIRSGNRKKGRMEEWKDGCVMLKYPGLEAGSVSTWPEVGDEEEAGCAGV